MADQTEKQLQRACALIQSKRYEDARALLLAIDHPTADRWLARLILFLLSMPITWQAIHGLFGS